MKRRLKLSILLLIFSVACAFPEGKRIAVFVDAPGAADGGTAKLAEDLTNEISYYLDISGEYTTIGFDGLPGDVSGENLADTAESFNLDQIVFASIPSSDQGNASVTLHIYDSTADRRIYLETTNADLSDGSGRSARNIVEPLADALLDIKNSWGTVQLTPRGVDGKYTVQVDGVPAGSNGNKLLWLPEGDHIIEALQTRPFGTQILLETLTTVKPKSDVSLSFTIPDLTDLERTAFEEIDKKILAAWDGDSDTVQSQFDLVNNLFTGIKASPKLENLKSKYKDWSEEFKLGRPVPKIEIAPPDKTVNRDDIAAEIEKDIPVIEKPPETTGSQNDVNVGSALLASVGPLLHRLGGVSRTLAHESMFMQDDGSQTYPSYSNMSYNVATTDEVLFWSSLGLYGGGAITESIIFPANTYKLSPLGKFFYSSGVVLDTAGNALSVLSQYLRTGTARLDLAYRDADKDDDIARIGDQLEELYDLYAFMRIGSYSAWGLGTAASVVAPFIGGNRSVAVSGPLQKALHIAGPIFTALGNLSSFVSYNARILTEERSELYYNGDFSTGVDLFEEYESAYTFYLWSTIGSYSLWGLGAISSILAVVLPEQTQSTGEKAPLESKPEPLFTVEPRHNGLYAGVRMVM